MTKKTKNTSNNNSENYISFNIGGDVYETFSNKKYRNRKGYQPVEFDKVRAFMPGTVKKIYVNEGDKVKEGAKLLVLEAMKMNNVLFSPSDGYVKKINAKSDTMVPKDHVLVELDIRE